MFEVILAVVVSSVLMTVAVSAHVAHRHGHDVSEYSPIDSASQDSTPYDGFVHHLCEYMRMHDQRYSLERPKVIEDFKEEMRNWNGEYKPVAKAFSKIGGEGTLDTIFRKYAKGHHAGEIGQMVKENYTDKEITRLILDEAWQHDRMPKVNKNLWKTIMRG